MFNHRSSTSFLPGDLLGGNGGSGPRLLKRGPESSTDTRRTNPECDSRGTGNKLYSLSTVVLTT